MDKLTHTIRDSRWKEIISQCQNRPAGMSAKQWIVENQISEKSYYYRLRKFRKEAYEHMNNPLDVLPAAKAKSEVSFTEIRIPEQKSPIPDIMHETIKPTAVIKTATMTIALSNDISDSLLSIILREVSHA